MLQDDETFLHRLSRLALLKRPASHILTLWFTTNEVHDLSTAVRFFSYVEFLLTCTTRYERPKV
jgi:hypothetical protein